MDSGYLKFAVAVAAALIHLVRNTVSYFYVSLISYNMNVVSNAPFDSDVLNCWWWRWRICRSALLQRHRRHL